MALFSNVGKILAGFLLAAFTPALVWGQGGFASQGSQFSIAGALVGDQVHPHVSIKTTGGYLVWQDNFTDGAGLGISARRLDGSLSGTMSSFRVNQNGTDDQERASVSMLNSGGAVFVWQGGKQGFQHIYARIVAANGTWTTGDLMVNTRTDVFQRESAVATLTDGNVIIAWSSGSQVSAGSMQDVYTQILTPTGGKIGTETIVNQTTPYNQRSVAVAPLSDGRYVVVWISEQQRFENSVDVYGRIYSASGVASGSEFLINTATNVCANPSVAAAPDGGFAVAWMQKDLNVATDSWDVWVRPFSGNALGGVTRRVNTRTYGDQLAPRISAMGAEYLMEWTSMGQDGSREGIYAQYLRGDGSLMGTEFRVNTTTASQQIQPVLASDGVSTFLTVWTSFVGGESSFDLYAQRYANTNQPVSAPDAPIVTVLSSNALSVSWPPVQGFSVAGYEVYADGDATPAAVVTDTYWKATGLAPGSTHSYQLAYVLVDGRRSPLSEATANTTYSGGATWDGIPQEWMAGFFGGNIFSWPAPYADPDNDGATIKDEYLAGTDPTDAESVLRIRLQPTVQGLYLNWNTQRGLMYQVQTAAGAAGPWSNLGGARFAADTTDSMYVGGSSVGFYRIVRLR